MVLGLNFEGFSGGFGVFVFSSQEKGFLWALVSSGEEGVRCAVWSRQGLMGGQRGTVENTPQSLYRHPAGSSRGFIPSCQAPKMPRKIRTSAKNLRKRKTKQLHLNQLLRTLTPLCLHFCQNSAQLPALEVWSIPPLCTSRSTLDNLQVLQ